MNVSVEKLNSGIELIIFRKKNIHGLNSFFTQ